MKKLWSLVIAIIAGNALYAQTLKVVDAVEGQAIEHAIVGVNTDDLIPLYTNDQGHVDISVLRDRKSINISALGYHYQTLSYQEIQELGFVVKLSPKPMALDQVVISASRWSQSSRELPYHISSLKSREIYFQSPQTAADLLGQSGEVFIQKSQQGGGSPMIRGFATNRLLIAVDGIRMNNAIFRSGNLQQVISLDPLAIDRSEVFFGPASVIYGSDAIGGVMSFNTLRPEFSIDTNLLVYGSAYSRYSSANQELSQHVDYNVGSEKLAWRGSFSYNRYGDLRMGSQGSDELLRPYTVQRIDSQDVVIRNTDPTLQLNTGFEQFHTLQKLRYRPSNHLDFEYSFMYSRTGDYDRYDRLIRTRGGLPRAAEWYYGPQVWAMNKFEVNYRKSNLLFDGATLRIASQVFKESRHDRDFGSTELNHRIEDVQALSLNLDLQKRISESHKLFYGLEAIRNDVRSTGTVEDIVSGDLSNTASRYPQSDWSSYAAYLNHEWEMSQKFTTQLGLRYNHFIINSDFSDNLAYYPLPFATAEINTGNVTGSLGFVFRPTENWKWRLNLGTAFRAPNVDDIGKIFDSGDAIVVVPNPDLKAEYAYNAEFGAATHLWDRIKLDISAYYTYLDQAMVRRPYTLNGQSSILYDGELSEIHAIQNAARAQVYGLQIGLDWNYNQTWFWRNQFNWQKGEEEDQDGVLGPSRHAAPWFGVSRIQFENKGLRLEANVQVSGEVSAENLNFEEAGKGYLYQTDAEGNAYSPGWYTLNFKSSYQLNEAWTISAGIENITDQRYRPYSSGLVAAGRNFILAARFQF
tara:strand:- start:177 stop:2591 length:2415 start_codon:yes stop_codon:yes gene_type:complete